MSDTAGLAIWQCVLLVAVLLAVAAILLKIGYWPRRRGDTLFCRKCGYNLTGAPSDLCSECGTTITPDTSIRGERQRRPVLIILGFLFVVLASIPAFWRLEQVDWYRFRPTAWLMSDFRSTAPNVPKRAWGELMRREALGRLSPSQQDRLIRLCLQEQVSQPSRLMTGDAIEFLAKRCLNGQLPRSQHDVFFEQMVMECRVRVKSQDSQESLPDVRGHYDIALVLCSPAMDLWFRVRQGIAVDAEEPSSWGNWKHIRGQAWKCERSTNGIAFRTRDTGAHTLRYLVELQVYSGPFEDLEASRLCHAFRVQDAADFTVSLDGSIMPLPEEGAPESKTPE